MCGHFCSCLTSTSDSAPKHCHTKSFNRGIRYEPATTVSHRGQPLRSAVGVSHHGRPSGSTTAVGHRGQPPRSAVAACQHGLPRREDHVTAHRHEHRDSARHPATLTGTQPAHKTSVPLLLTKVSSEPHNSHRSGGPTAWHPAHSVSATP